MSYRNLRVQAMVGVSRVWIDPNGERPIFERTALLLPFLGELETAHSALVTIQVTSSSVAEEIKKLTQRATALDALHDRKVRGIFGVLTDLAELADDPETAAGYLGLRDQLFPSGLKAIQRSDLDESGEVVLARGRLTEEIRTRLKSLTLPEGTLSDQVDDWFAAGEELGDVERRRVQLSNNKDDDGFTQGDVARARNRWIRVIGTIVNVLDLLPDLPESDRIRILQPLLAAKADRARRTDTDDDAEEIEEPSADDTPAEDPEETPESAPAEDAAAGEA